MHLSGMSIRRIFVPLNKLWISRRRKYVPANVTTSAPLNYIHHSLFHELNYIEIRTHRCNSQTYIYPIKHSLHVVHYY